ncbi:MAG: hypothetical protein SPF70_10565 [Lachnospiraceae bacterium]|nr:hypothetical protein [Lachnospiraceae bacterium]
MKKIYETPAVTVTKWASQDVITTSGEIKSVSSALTINTVDSGITSVSYNEIQ